MKKTLLIVTTIAIIIILITLFSNKLQNNDGTFTKEELQKLNEVIPTVIGIVQTKQDDTFTRATLDFSDDSNIAEKITAMHPYIALEDHANGKAYQVVTSIDAVPSYNWVDASEVYEITADPSPKRDEVEQFLNEVLSSLQKSYQTLNSDNLATYYNTESHMYKYEVSTIEKMKQDERKIRIIDFKVLDVLRHGDTYWPIVVVKYHRYWPGEIRRSTYYEYSIYNVHFHADQPRIESLQLYFR